MSTNTENSANETEVETVKKTAQAVFYIPEEYGSHREFSQEVDDTTDYFDKNTSDRTRHTYKLIYPGTSVEIDEESYHLLQDQVLGAGRLSHETETETESHYVNRTYKFIRGAYRKRWPDESPFEDFIIRTNWGNVRIDGERVFNTYHSETECAMLRDFDDQEPDDIFLGDDEDRLAFVVRFKFEDMPEEYVEWSEENLVKGPVAEVAREYPFDTVKMVKCFERTEVTTECPRI